MTATLYLGTDDGVAVVEQSDATWSVRTATTPAWSVEEVAVSPSDPKVVLAGTRGDGVWRSDDGGATFRKPSYGRRGPGKVRCLAFDPLNPARVYAGCEPIDLFVSNDGGSTWEAFDSIWDHPWVQTVVYPRSDVEPHVRDIAIAPDDPDLIYVALQVGGILRTTDGGKSWQLLKDGCDSDVHTIVIDAADARHLVIATGGHDSRLGTSGGRALFASTDRGDSWHGVGMNFEQEYSVPLVAHPAATTTLFSSLAAGNPGEWRKRDSGAESALIRSTDNGENWEAADTSEVADFTRSFATAIAGDPNSPETVYGVLTDGRLISSDDRGATWTALGVSVPHTNDMKVVVTA